MVSACRKYEQLKDSESPETKKWGVSMEGIKMPRVLSHDEKSVPVHALNSRHRLSKTVAIIAGHMSYLKEFVVALT
jgi:hypothetical protein